MAKYVCSDSGIQFESNEGWIKCADQMPEKDGRYIVYENPYGWIGVCAMRNGKFDSYAVTHWMYLPEAPK